MSSMSVCRMSGLKSRRISRISSRVGWRVTATQAILPRAGAASSAARCVVTWRTEVANTKPIASTSQAMAVLTATGVVMPQILMKGRGAEVMRGLRFVLAQTPRHGLARAWRAPVAPDRMRT